MAGRGRPQLASPVLACLASLLVLGAALAWSDSALAAKPIKGAHYGASHSRPALPIVVVHGFHFSGGTYASVAQRFASNGYPPDRICTFEYASSGAGIGAAPGQLDTLIDQLRASYGVDRVNLVAHSLGTVVAGIYLSVASRAARSPITSGSTPPATRAAESATRTSTAWGSSWGRPAMSVGTTSTNHSQAHVEALTSPESFAAQYRFFTGEHPRTTSILPEPPGQVEIAGRAVNQLQNTGLDGGTLGVW